MCCIARRIKRMLTRDPVRLQRFYSRMTRSQGGYNVKDVVTLLSLPHNSTRQQAEEAVGRLLHEDIVDVDDDDDIFGCCVHSDTKGTGIDLSHLDLMYSKDPIGGGLEMVLSQEESVYIKEFLTLAKVWGYHPGCHTAFEKVTHDKSFYPHGRQIQYVTDRLMRTLASLDTGSPIMLTDYRDNLKGAIESFPKVIESTKASAFINRFVYHVGDNNRMDMYQLTKRLADYKVDNHSSFLMASIVGSARALLAISTGDRTGVDMFRALQLRIDEMDDE